MDIEKINSKEELVSFIDKLKNDFITNKNEWENISLEDYLESIKGWIEEYKFFTKYSKLENRCRNPNCRKVLRVIFLFKHPLVKKGCCGWLFKGLVKQKGSELN